MNACSQCGTSLPPRKPRAKARKWCSEACRVAAWRAKGNSAPRRTAEPRAEFVANCAGCGFAFTVRRAPGRAPRYCDLCQHDILHHSKGAARARQAGGVVGALVLRRVIFERDNWHCHVCGDAVDPAISYPHARSATTDHIEPIKAGGAHDPTNVKLAHFGCNMTRPGGQGAGPARRH